MASTEEVGNIGWLTAPSPQPSASSTVDLSASHVPARQGRKHGSHQLRVPPAVCAAMKGWLTSLGLAPATIVPRVHLASGFWLLARSLSVWPPLEFHLTTAVQADTHAQGRASSSLLLSVLLRHHLIPTFCAASCQSASGQLNRRTHLKA